MNYTDCHLHLPLGDLAGLCGGVVAAITPGDWQAVLDASAGALLPALGVHPWHVGECDLEEVLPQLEALLLAHPECAVGEIGLDGCPGKSPMELQRLWFRAQLALAARLKRPAVLHLVRAWEDAWEILPEFAEAPMVVHGFHGGPQEVRKLLSFPNLYLSLGFDALTPGKHFAAGIRAIPPERLLLDSDAPCRGHASSETPMLLDSIARRKSLEPEALSAIINQNFQKLFQSPNARSKLL